MSLVNFPKDLLVSIEVPSPFSFISMEASKMLVPTFAAHGFYKNPDPTASPTLA